MSYTIVSYSVQCKVAAQAIYDVMFSISFMGLSSLLFKIVRLEGKKLKYQADK